MKVRVLEWAVENTKTLEAMEVEVGDQARAVRDIIPRNEERFIKAFTARSELIKYSAGVEGGGGQESWCLRQGVLTVD